MTKMNITHYLFLPLLFLSQLVSHSAQESTQDQKCQDFSCGWLGPIGYPFFRIDHPKCGVIAINCNKTEPKVQFHEKGSWYLVKEINYPVRRIIVNDEVVQNHLQSNHCDLLGDFTEQVHLKNFTQQVPPSVSFNIAETHPVLKCKNKPHFPSTVFNQFRNYSCNDYDLYYENQEMNLPYLSKSLSNSCSVVNLTNPKISGKKLPEWDHSLILEWGATSIIYWNVSQACVDYCSADAEECPSIPDKGFKCGEKQMNEEGGIRKGLKVAIGFGAAAGTLFLTFLAFVVYRRHKRNRSSSSSALISRDLSRDNSLKPDPEKGSLFFETKLFTYKELDEATNHFDSNKELGDGGFGTVYYGKLRDGRVVAVKRLFEHNYKRVEQFMNEIEILSRLRHQNLVSLYGCTSRHSRELLLVYEFVPNGTVADHLHGERAKEGLLTWPIRMSIAIQSADALTYLHASEIIHRDVKTNNILLDNNFHVKVADFGLSRLFPTNVTHVSTAPQGTPGYVDPEYYQCYQLTSKSDVYSFGVVLIELISSKPAVDIGRHRHEINLASLAVNKIHNQALHELVDPSLGYDTDYSVRNMVTLVAELAFRCLQQENEMRPCMTEVLEILRGIENEEYMKTKTDDMDTSAVARLLKKSEPLSPDTVTGKWSSKDSTPNVSG